MTDLTPEQLEAIVQKHVTQLREFFPAVQILVSHELESGETGSISLGAGNWYARIGMCHSMLESDQANTLVHKMPKPPPDDSEDWKDN